MPSRNDKYQRYLSFDLNTKSKDFDRKYYSQVRNFLIKLGFTPLKDSNYLSLDKLSDYQTRTINKQICNKFPDFVKSCNKFDWTVFHPDLVNRSVTAMKAIINKSK